MTSFFGRFKSGAGPASPASSSPLAKKDPNAPQLTLLEKLLADAGPVRSDGSDKFFGFENFRTTCFCNSIIQCLYHSVLFREQIINFPSRSPPEALERLAQASSPQLNTDLLSTSNGQNSALSPKGRSSISSPSTAAKRKPGPSPANPMNPQATGPENNKDSPEYKKKQALAAGPVLTIDYGNSKAYGMSESLFSALKDIFEAVIAHRSHMGVVKPHKFLEILRREDVEFRTRMTQDPHEFLNLLLDKLVDDVEYFSKSRVKELSDPEVNGLTINSGAVVPDRTSTISTSTGWVHELFEGTLTSETRCLTCENTLQRDELFLTLSVDLEQHSSVTSSLRKFSEEEMLCGRNKFYCDNCGALEEAEKRMKIKRLPRILALHLKRFKYTEDYQRLQKSFHRVLYPYYLRLFNTTDDAEDPDRLYELYAVVVHMGSAPDRGHFASIIKTQDRGWMLFDDEMVEPVDKAYVRHFFGGGNNLACAYVLFYQETTEEAMQRELETEGLAAAKQATEIHAELLSITTPKANGVANRHPLMNTTTTTVTDQDDQLASLNHAVTAHSSMSLRHKPKFWPGDQETWADSLFRKERYEYVEEGGYLYQDLLLRGRYSLQELDRLSRLDGWHYTFDNNFALEFFKSLPSIQLAPVQCCSRCTSIVAANCNINLSEVNIADKNCHICALLLRAVKHHCNDDERNVQIVRERSVLKMGSNGPRILRLYCVSESSADLDNNTKISFPVLPEAESPARFALLRAWLRWCDKSHNCNNDTKSETVLPTRLLYIGDPNPDVLCLYCPKENDRVKYIALSHCWGKNPPTKKNPQFCTTDNNIKARLKGFSFSELPTTFRDAVQVTRELGIPYLWIDSLCIIQWNQNDWEYEARRMEGVFASAYCTIAATSAVDSKAGFLKRNVSNECVLVQDALGRRFYICADTDDSNNHVDMDDFDDHVEKAPLNTRAWVMQERILSRRTIHFSDKQMYWECGEGVYCETLTRLESSFRKTYFVLDPNFPDRLLRSGRRRTTEFIHFLFEAYSKRHLTEETDRCVAITGLEARIAHAIGCESRYGIFQRYLHRSLLWQRSDEEKAKRIGYKPGIVPSWSWMAYSGGIQFMDIEFGDVEWNDKLQFNTEHKHALNISKRKRRHALVTDIGVFRNCSLEQRDTSYAVLDLSKVERGRIQYDIEASEGLHAEMCVVVGRKSSEKAYGLRNKYYILVVRPTNVDGEYTRVGAGWIQSYYVARQRLNVRVV